MPKKVLVTGATGRTGALVLQKLRQQPEAFTGIGFARSQTKAEELFGSLSGFRFGDIMDRTSLDLAMADCDALVILTSAAPLMKAPAVPGERPELIFLPNATPEIIDYHGQRHQIDAAIATHHIQQIVLVGSMGGTNPHHPLNKMGNGNILLWKRKAEQYLIDSGLPYTIIRAGGLLDQPGGQRELLVGKQDAFFAESPNRIPTSIPRADVAEVVIQALRHDQARNKAFDVISKPMVTTANRVTTNFAHLFDQTTAGL